MYIFTSIVLFLFVLITWNSPNSKRKPLYFIGALWLLLIEGLRWQIGTDWDSYYNFFVNGYDEGHIEFGYSILVETIRKLSDSYTFYLLFQASLTIAAFSFFIKRYSPNIIMSLCIFFCSMVGLWGMNRQFICLDICLLSIPFIEKRKPLYFLLFVSVAFLIHKSALLFLPAYFLYNFRLSSKVLFSVVFVTLLIGLSGVLKKIEILNMIALYTANSDTMTKMLTEDANAYSYLGTLKRLIYILFFFQLYKKNTDNNICRFLFNMYFFGVLIFLTFNGSNFQLFVGRGAIFYNMSEMVLLPMSIYGLIKKPANQILAWTTLFILIFLLMNRDLSSYIPIAGYDVFRPYNSVLF